LILVTLSSPAKLKGHVQSPTADYSAMPIENPANCHGQTDAKDIGIFHLDRLFLLLKQKANNSDGRTAEVLGILTELALFCL